MKPANYVEDHADRGIAANQSSKRKAVVVIRERDGRTIPAVFKSQAASVAFIKSRVERGTTIQADDAAAWDNLYARFCRLARG